MATGTLRLNWGHGSTSLERMPFRTIVQSDVTARAVQGDDAIESRIRNFWSEVGGIH